MTAAVGGIDVAAALREEAAGSGADVQRCLQGQTITERYQRDSVPRFGSPWIADIPGTAPTMVPMCTSPSSGWPASHMIAADNCHGELRLGKPLSGVTERFTAKSNIALVTRS